MRKRLLYNTLTSLLLQLVTVIRGFILPKYILLYFGSEVNGLVSSITRFLSLITFLEMGVGAVIQSSLYEPLAKKNQLEISEIIVSGGAFFKKIAQALLVYVIILVIFFPIISNTSSQFDWFFTATLIVSISISSFAQYYFGIIDRLLLAADQKGYIQYGTQIITLLVNLLISVALVKAGYSIQSVKLVSSLLFLIKPLVIRVYVNKQYNINRKLKLTREPIKQKWNGIAQHIAAIILSDTDTVVLTIFSTMANVSIYSVYFMIVNGITCLIKALASGMQSIVGDLWARKEYGKLNNFFEIIELFIHSITTLFFSCMLILIVPFVKVYTIGISDVNYNQPLFAVLLVAAYGVYCLRMPYIMVIFAGSHYKQTQKCFIVAAILNILISMISVSKWGLVGVAIGTLVAMVYQTGWMALYDSKNLIKRSFKNFVRQCCIDIVSTILTIFVTSLIRINVATYFDWVGMAILFFIIASIITFGTNFIFNKCKMKNLFMFIFKRTTVFYKKY